MSAVVNALAVEADRVRATAEAYSRGALTMLIEDVRAGTTPSTAGSVDARNIIMDPYHLGPGQDWDAVNAVLSLKDDDVPRFAKRAVVATGETATPYLRYAFSTRAEALVDNPIAPTVTPQGVAGSTTYSYRIAARDGRGQAATSAPGRTTTGNATLSATNYNRVTWAAVPGADSYAIYGRTSGAETLLAVVDDVITTYDDTGVTGTGAAPQSVPHYLYAYVWGEAGQSVTLRVTTRYASLNWDVGTVALPAGTGGGWVLVRLPVALEGNTPYHVRLNANSAPIGAQIRLTGVTISRNFDPGESFSGDSETTDQYAYAWEGVRHGSASTRHTQAFELISLREKEFGFPLDPTDLSVEQRRNYLTRRFQARRKPWGNQFVTLIVELIKSEVPNFTRQDVRVIEDYANYTFSVEVAYSEFGKLSNRLRQLVEDISPAHLRLTEVKWGTFRAGISKAGDPV